MKFSKVPLEEWMREFYFNTPIDLGSSGFRPFSFAEVRKMAHISEADLNQVVFDDSATHGALGLRQAIADQWGDGNAENVMVSHGSNDVAFQVMMGLLSPGDEVVTTWPIYHTHDKIAESLGCTLKRYTLDWRNGFQVDMDHLTSLITPNTKMVVVNFPHNPTGTSLNLAQYHQLIEACAAVDAFLVWDAALQDLVFEGEPLPAPFPSYRKALVIGTMSKAYAMPGVRIGWCLGAAEYFEPCLVWKDFTTLYVSPWIEMVAQKAIENAETLRAARFAEAASNFKSLQTWIATMDAHVSWRKPTGGVTAFVHLKQVQRADTFCKALAAEKGVMLVPGTAFGHPQHARLGFAAAPEQFTKGLQLLAEHLHQWPQRPENQVPQSAVPVGLST